MNETRGNNSVSETGYVYIPASCQNRTIACRLHVSLHGCYQNQAIIGDAYALFAGYNEWAEGSNIVVLYPYVLISDASVGDPLVDNYNNSKGCWDWWGYSGNDYGLKTGPQMRMIYNMINALSLSPAYVETPVK